MSARPAHLGLHHVALFVDDLNAALHFWVTLLGYAIEWQPDPDNVYLSSGSDNVALHRATAPAETGQPRGRAQTLDHLGIVVAEASDVHAWQSYLQDNHVSIVAQAKLHRDGATSCYVRCPSGVVVQILHHPPISPRLSTLGQGRPGAPRPA